MNSIYVENLLFNDNYNPKKNRVSIIPFRICPVFPRRLTDHFNVWRNSRVEFWTRMMYGKQVEWCRYTWPLRWYIAPVMNCRHFKFAWSSQLKCVNHNILEDLELRHVCITRSYHANHPFPLLSRINLAVNNTYPAKLYLPQVCTGKPAITIVRCESGKYMHGAIQCWIK